MKPLTINIILNSTHDLPTESFLVRLNQSKHISLFQDILKTQPYESAIVFALSKGRLVSSQETDSQAQLTLTEEGAYWDLTI